ncbi:MAG: ECF transporter S component [Nitrososphaerales archaeon]
MEKGPTLASREPPKSSRARIIAATGLFSALAIILASVSQALGLNFPLIPYLQFDFGEVVILTAFLLFGPWPAIASAFVEFITLMAFGQNAPYGPILKIIAILSSIAGIWLGMKFASRISSKGTAIIGSGLILGIISRAAVLTVANYYLIVYIYTVSGTVFLVNTPLKLIGITLTDSNWFLLILGLTALFNCLQLIMGFVLSYTLTRLPQLRRSLRTSRMAWFETLGKEQKKSTK